MTDLFWLLQRRSFARLGVSSVLWLAGVASAAMAAQPVATLTGVWMPNSPHALMKPVAGDSIALTAAGRAAYAANTALLQEQKGKKVGRDDLSGCIALGPTRLLQQPFPLQIVQRANLFIVLYEHNHVFEIVYLAEKPDTNLDPGFMGNSVGTWTRDGIGITTTGFKDGTFLDDSGLPHSDQLSLTRTLRVTDNGNRLEVVSEITDPPMYKHAWSVRQTLTHRPDLRFEEFVCGQGPTVENRYTRGGISPPEE
jgi:hypothetical protein